MASSRDIKIYTFLAYILDTSLLSLRGNLFIFV